MDKRLLILLVFIAIVLAHHFLVFLGFYGMDDINYARYAAKVASGELFDMKASNPLELRWGLIYPVALFYKCFGINDFTSVLPGMISVVLTGFLIYRVLYRESLWILIAALALFFLNYNTLFATHRIWPDSIMMLSFFALFYLYQKYRIDTKSNWIPIAFSVVIFLAMITKGSLILLLPLLVFLFIRDMVQRKLYSFWAISAFSVTLLFFIYFLAFKVSTGDWFYRYSLLRSNYYTDGECSFEYLPFVYTLRRIGYTLWEAFLLNGDLSLLLFGLSGFIYRKTVMPEGRIRDISVAFFILLLSANFMTISYKNYVPLCQDPRHFMFLFPFAAISGAYALKSYFINPRKYWIVLLLSVAATSWIFLIRGGETKYVYLLISVTLALPFIIKSDSILHRLKAFLLLFVLCLLIRPAYDIYADRFSYYHEHKRFVLENFSRGYQHSLIFSGNDLTAELSEYFLKFNTGTTLFRHIRYADSLIKGYHGSLYILTNKKVEGLFSETVNELVEKNPRSIRMVGKGGPFLLYKVDSAGIIKSIRPGHTGSVHQ